MEVGNCLTERNLTVALLEELERKAPTTRPDLKRIEAQQSVQELTVAIAKSSFGPRLNAFAGWQMDNPTFLAGGGGNNWLGGIELQIDLFQGGPKREVFPTDCILDYSSISLWARSRTLGSK